MTFWEKWMLLQHHLQIEAARNFWRILKALRPFFLCLIRTSAHLIKMIHLFRAFDDLYHWHRKVSASGIYWQQEFAISTSELRESARWLYSLQYAVEHNLKILNYLSLDQKPLHKKLHMMMIKWTRMHAKADQEMRAEIDSAIFVETAIKKEELPFEKRLEAWGRNCGFREKFRNDRYRN